MSTTSVPSSTTAALASAGVGSGLDVASIVSSLMAVEKVPYDQLTTQKTSYQSEISAFGTLKSALSTFQTSVQKLSSASNFNAQTATSSDTTTFTAKSDGTASVADYSVSVSQLAKSQKLDLGGFANTTDVVGTGTLTFSFGSYDSTGNTFTPNASKSSFTVNINSSNNTLSGIQAAINAAGGGVTASIVNDGTTNHLVLTSNDTGATNTLKITAADDDGNNTDASGLSKLAYDPTAASGAGKNMSQLQAAQNAIINVDGMTITKPSNTITDAIQGLTINLLKVNTSSVDLNVATDTNTVQTSVQNFVNAYNTLNTTLKNLTNYDSAGNGANNGPLIGDPTTRAIQFQIKSVFTRAINDGNNIDSLNQIGVTFQNDGTLGLDTTKLSSAMSSSFSQIAALFSTSATTTDPYVSYNTSTTATQSGTYPITVTQLGSSTTSVAGTINGVAATSSGNYLDGATGDPSSGLSVLISGGGTGSRGTITFTKGYASQLDDILTNLLSSTGSIATATNGLNTSVTDINTQQTAMQTRLDQMQATYQAQFTSLDTMMSTMNTTSTYLTQQLSQMASSTKSMGL